MVICLELGADLHMSKLMPLPLTVCCISKIQIGFTFLVMAHLGSPRQSAIKRVCVCACILQPCFDLPRHTWSLMNCFRTGQGPCRANLHDMGSRPITYGCCQRQTMKCIVDTCPLTKFEDTNQLHEVDDDAVIWLDSTATAALAK